MRKLAVNRIAVLGALFAGLLTGSPQAAAQHPGIQVLTTHGEWTTCGSSSLGDPTSVSVAMPAWEAGSEVEFEVREIAAASSFERLQVRESVTRFPIEDAVPETLTLHQIGLRSSPAFASSGPLADKRAATIRFNPPAAGVYRFEISGGSHESPSCFVEVPVYQQGCFLTTATGIGPNGNSAVGVLDFGEVPVDVTERGFLRLTAVRNWVGGDQFRYQVTQPVDPAFQPENGYTVSGRQATAGITFTPDRAGAFRSVVQVVGRPDGQDDSAACWQNLVLQGTGGSPQLTIEFESLTCGATPEAIVVVRNDGGTQVDNLDARASSGFLIPNPSGSFSASNFSLGPSGSSNPPSERRFTYRYPASGSGGSITVQQGTTQLAAALIPAAPACIEVVDPAQLSLDFGDVPVGTAAPDRSIVLRNLGDAAATVTASLGSTGPGQGFRIGSGQGIAEQLNLPGRGSVSLPVGFLPPSLGRKSSTVSFTTPGAQIDSVVLTGNGVAAPAVNLSFSSGGAVAGPGGVLTLPSAKVGESSPGTVTITNTSNVPALGLELSVGGDFSIASLMPSMLNPGQSTTQTILFAPAQTGLRSGSLVVAGSNLTSPAGVTLQAQGLPADVRLALTGLSPVVAPAQTPAPSVGIEISGTAPSEAIEGDLVVDFSPDTAQAVGPEFQGAYSVVRFLSGTGAAQQTIAFRIEAGQSRAVFPAEQNAGAAADLARFQTGSVAGTIRFRLANLRTSAGAAVGLSAAPESIVQVPRASPRAQMTMQRTGGGADLVVDIVSTPREITGVCVSLSPSAGSDLSFQRPAAEFLNGNFGAWFSDPANYQHGGALTLTIPVAVDNPSTLGSAQVWIRNSQGWSSPGSPCP